MEKKRGTFNISLQDLRTFLNKDCSKYASGVWVAEDKESAE